MNHKMLKGRSVLKALLITTGITLIAFMIDTFLIERVRWDWYLGQIYGLIVFVWIRMMTEDYFNHDEPEVKA